MNASNAPSPAITATATRDYLAHALIQTQQSTLSQCVRHMSAAIAARNIVYTGLTALRIMLIETPDCPKLSDDPFHVAYADPLRRPTRLHTRYLKIPETLRAQGTVTYRYDGNPITCTHPLVTWAMLAPRLTQAEVIVLADAIIRAGARSVGNNGFPLSTDDFAVFLNKAGDFPGVGKCRAALTFLAGTTDSTMECRTLLAFLRYGLPYPVIHWQTRIAEPDALVTADLAYPDKSLVVEYDGDAHRQDKRQYRWDERKRQALRAQGCTVIVAFADDVLTERGRKSLTRRVAQALGVELPGTPLPQYRVLLDDDRRDRDRARQRRCRARKRGMAGTGL